MNEKEEKLFDKKFCMEDYDISFSDIKDIKNWITEHDKREREMFIEEIEKLKNCKCENMVVVGFNFTKCNDCGKNYKNNEKYSDCK